MSLSDMRNSDMMVHLLDSLAVGEDIGHYGRLVVAMVGHHFVDEEELVATLVQNPGFGEAEARSLVAQVTSRNYNPPKRERILEWQARQEFPICPNPDDPRACNVYRDLQFPEDVYQEIEEFYADVAEGEAETAQAEPHSAHLEGPQAAVAATAGARSEDRPRDQHLTTASPRADQPKAARESPTRPRRKRAAARK